MNSCVLPIANFFSILELVTPVNVQNKFMSLISKCTVTKCRQVVVMLLAGVMLMIWT